MWVAFGENPLEKPRVQNVTLPGLDGKQRFLAATGTANGFGVRGSVWLKVWRSILPRERCLLAAASHRPAACSRTYTFTVAVRL